MPRYKVVDGFRINQDIGDVKQGDVVDVPENEARVFVAQQRLTPVTEDKPAKPAENEGDEPTTTKPATKK